MNSRERILMALNGGIPDRVPVSTYELVGYNSRAWENWEPSYSRLMESIRERTDCICMWNPVSNESFLGSSVQLDMEVARVRDGGMIVTRRLLHAPLGNLSQTEKVADDVRTVWRTERWCKSIDDVEAALAVPYVPLEYDGSDLSRIRAEVADNGIVMSSVGDPLLHAAELMGFGDFTVWAMTETAHFARTIEILSERVLENLSRMLDAAQVDLYRICGPEYATPPFLPPHLFDRFVEPHVSEMVRLIHGRGAKARLHCHGRVSKVLDAIARTGADGLDPCEPPPDGDISLVDVKGRVGHCMCLFGNLELKLLETGTAEAVGEAVHQCMRAAKHGGGFVFMPTAAPINVPLAPQTEANYMRFIDAALEGGQY